MDTDDKLTTEGMAGEEPSGKVIPPKMKLWKKVLAIFIGLVLLSVFFGAFIVWREDLPEPGQLYSQSYIDFNGIPCNQTLYGIQDAVNDYYVKYRTWPETIEALVPEFMNEVWECKKGGTYYLDASQTPPIPVCPYHGTTESFKWQYGTWEWGGRWINKNLLEMLAILCLFIGYLGSILVIWLHRRKLFRRAGVDDEGT